MDGPSCPRVGPPDGADDDDQGLKLSTTPVHLLGLLLVSQWWGGEGDVSRFVGHSGPYGVTSPID